MIIEDVQNWAQEKGIYNKSKAVTQYILMYIELGEFADAILEDSPLVEKQTELGDVMVCLINYLTMASDKTHLLNEMRIMLRHPPIDKSFTQDDLLVGFMYCDELSVFINSIIPLYATAVNSTPIECLTLAYNKIIIREGEMVNGKFVKSSDL